MPNGAMHEKTLVVVRARLNSACRRPRMSWTGRRRHEVVSSDSATRKQRPRSAVFQREEPTSISLMSETTMMG